MNLFTISLSYLKSRGQNTILNIFMMAAGMMIIAILLLFTHQAKERLVIDSKGIDSVIGAKGSPLQLVLSTIWHVDIPTGNIDLKSVNKIKKNRQINKAIPISLGDSYRGFRIVGSETSYIKHFGASFDSGAIWSKSMEAVIGYQVAKKSGLKIGDSFHGSHGLVAGGEVHGDQSYKVVGILQPTKSVLDRLIVTSLDSVWDVHGHGHKKHKHHSHDHHKKEVTALLISYKNKMAAINYPRYINKSTNMQAANPSFEIARLVKLIGIGKDSFILFGALLIFLSLSSMLIALLNLVYQRRYDLAIFRSLGSSRGKIFSIIIIEGMIICFIGSLIGMLSAHLLLELIGFFNVKASELGLRGFILLPEIFILWALTLLLCLIICLIPAIRAYKADIKDMLTNAT